MRRWQLFWIAAVLAALPLASMFAGCASSPPRELDDLCAIFSEKRSWYQAAKRSRERWGVSEALQLAIVHQESRFRAKARPPRRKLLWVLPGPRRSSAYGYAQVVDGTWDQYRRASGRAGADRDDFADTTDFLGWYGHRIHRRTGLEKTDAFGVYLAYHEGPAGFRRGAHRAKPWLDGVARKVASRTKRYERQYVGCREQLDAPRFWPW